MPTEAQGIAEGIGHRLLMALHTVIQIQLLFRLPQAHCPVEESLLDFLHAGDELHRPGGSQQMPYHGFGGIDTEPFRVVTEGELDGPGLEEIVVVGGSAVGIDIAQRLGLHAAVRQGVLHSRP